MKKNSLIILLRAFVLTLNGQINSWVRIIDNKTQAEFSMPENPMHIDTLSTALYVSPIDSTKALQVRHRGLELGIKYLTLQSNTPYSSFVRYYFDNNNFIAFTWTGNYTTMRKYPENKIRPCHPHIKIVFSII